MHQNLFRIAAVLTLSLAVHFASAAPPRKEGGRSEGGNPAEGRPPGHEPKGQSGRPEPGKSAPGGSWSEPTHHASQGAGQPGHAANAPPANGAGAAAHRNQTQQPSNAQAAAAGAAAENRKEPQATGAQGAAAGAAAANRNAPQVSGAQGAAAGAAVANRNNPQLSGAQGAAAGAAVANRKDPQLSGAQGAAAGAAVANRNDPQLSGAQGAALGSAAVRNSFNNPNLYSQQWYGANPGVWTTNRWSAGSAWTPTTWGAVAGFTGAATAPVSYSYGNNVTYQDGNILVAGQSVGTATEFSQQAADLAQTGVAAADSATDEWLPLGVFAMVRNEQQHPQLILQLAVNKQGILRGNYTDELTEHTLPIHGAVDPKTQRAAWIVGNNANSVMEAGMSNLASREAPALIHKSGKTDHWLLVRLDEPAAQ